MYFKREDGTAVENTTKLDGRMKPAQQHYFARKFAADAQHIAQRKSYGVGEVGYYIKEDCFDLVEWDIATQGEAIAIFNEAEDLLWQADDLGATLDQPMYLERYENARQIATEEDLERERKRLEAEEN